MNILQIGWKNLAYNKPVTLLNLVLVALGIGILSTLMVASEEIGNKLEQNAKDIDLVVGAKGSPLQLILSSIYHVDFPTGNIPAKEAYALMHNPLVKLAVPLALGDNYNGYRIVGTDHNFIKLYGLKLAQGNFWKNDLDVTIGDAVAKTNNLKIGDTFFGAHGLSDNQDVHKQHAYVVRGILKPAGNVTDQLVLTNIGSVYKMHETHEVEVEHPAKEIKNQEITSILIQYKSVMSVVLFPRMVNKTTGMQAASPAIESARLFSLIGIGLDTLKGFSILIMVISALSIFIGLYTSMRHRKYDLAIMRCLGASKTKLFSLIILEGVLLTFMGTLIGIVLAHVALEWIGQHQESAQARLTGFYFVYNELYLALVGLLIGVSAALIPAFQMYRVDLAKTLTRNR